MIDLSDVTFNIPIKIDQPDRIRNIQICVDYLNKNFKTNLIICEMDQEQKAKNLLENISCKYIFMKTNSPYFHRTMMLNYMAKNSDTPIVVNYDCDVLLPIQNYVLATELIRNKTYDLVYPYDGNFFDVNPNLIGKIKETNSIDDINTQTMCRNLRPAGDSLGGAIFWSKEKFFSFGLENEKCISWGYEDNERFDRAKTLDLRIGRCPSGLIHLHHGSSLNSSNGSHPFYQKNEQEWIKIKNMNKNDLTAYIKTWAWAKEFVQ